MHVVDEVWNDELECAWRNAPSPRWWGASVPAPRRLCARHAVGELCDTWRSNAGPEYAAEQGVPVNVIVEHLGRAPLGTLDELELLGPPTTDDIRAWLAEGWILKWYRGADSACS